MRRRRTRTFAVAAAACALVTLPPRISLAGPANPCDLADPYLDLDGRPIDAQGNPLAPCPDPLQAPGGAAPTELSVSVGRWRVRPGETVLVPVVLANPRAVAVTNLNVQLGYKASVVVAVAPVRNGTVFDNALRESNTNRAERVLLGVARPAGAAGETATGNLFVVAFKATGQPGDTTPVSVSVTAANGPSGEVLRPVEVPGEIEILATDGGVVGDCDGDGVMRENDALCALQVSVQLLSPTDGQRRALDVDTDGDITSRDAAVILQRSTGRTG